MISIDNGEGKGGSGLQDAAESMGGRATVRELVRAPWREDFRGIVAVEAVDDASGADRITVEDLDSLWIDGNWPWSGSKKPTKKRKYYMLKRRCFISVGSQHSESIAKERNWWGIDKTEIPCRTLLFSRRGLTVVKRITLPFDSA